MGCKDDLSQLFCRFLGEYFFRLKPNPISKKNYNTLKNNLWHKNDVTQNII